MYARVLQAMAQFVLKIELLSHIMGTTLILEMARAYGLRPRLWLLVSKNKSNLLWDENFSGAAPREYARQQVSDSAELNSKLFCLVIPVILRESCGVSVLALSGLQLLTPTLKHHMILEVSQGSLSKIILSLAPLRQITQIPVAAHIALTVDRWKNS